MLPSSHACQQAFLSAVCHCVYGIKAGNGFVVLTRQSVCVMVQVSAAKGAV